MNSLPATGTLAALSEHATMYVAIELSKASWKLGVVLPGLQKMSCFTLDGGDTAGLAALLGRKQREAEVRCRQAVKLVSCYEAGYDGFWLHRWLERHEVKNHVLDPASIEVERRKRRAKTDRLDLDKLMRVLLAIYRGEPRVCREAQAPSLAAEDAKRPHRERERLLKERTAHVNRIKGLLHGQGIRDINPRAELAKKLTELRTGDGEALPPALAAEIGREYARLRLLMEQIVALEAEIHEGMSTASAGSTAAKAARLHQLVAIGVNGAQLLAHEIYYRSFANARQVGSYTGLAGTPYNSGETRREQGISKAGNPRVRTMLIELAWLWRRFQPDSELTRWFNSRIGEAKGRVRKIFIVALARKLAVALWRYLETGLVPTGARLRATPAI